MITVIEIDHQCRGR